MIRKVQKTLFLTCEGKIKALSMLYEQGLVRENRRDREGRLISDQSYLRESLPRVFQPRLNRNRTCGHTCLPVRYVHC